MEIYKHVKIELASTTIKFVSAYANLSDLPLTLNTLPGTLQVSGKQGHYEAIVVADGIWTPSTETPWITVAQLPENRVSIKVAANPGVERAGSVVITVPGEGEDLTDTIVITQSAADAIEHGPSVLKVNAAAGASTVDFNLLTNVGEYWRVFGINTWVQVKDNAATRVVGAGKGTTTLKLALKANTTGKVRKTKVQFTIGRLTYDVIVTQAAV